MRKDDVGQLIGDKVILLENKPEIAADLLLRKYKAAASNAVDELDRQNAIIDYLQKWRAEHE